MVSHILQDSQDVVHTLLTACETRFDPLTTARIAQLGVVPRGGACLDVGAGAGSIARWLAERVGPEGSVVATDIETRFLDQLALPNVRAVKHDLTTDALPEGGPYDLVHVRLVLGHLPGRDAIVKRLASVLKPGGVLLLEEFDLTSCASEPPLFTKVNHTVGKMIARTGGNVYLALELPRLARQAGLEVELEDARLSPIRGGDAFARFFGVAWTQLRPKFVASGMLTEEEVDAALATLRDPAFEAVPPLLVGVGARRPK